MRATTHAGSLLIRQARTPDTTDSTCLGVLVGALKRLRAGDGQLRLAAARCGQHLPGPGQLWQRRPVLLSLLAAGDLGVGVWLLWHARRHHGWDRPGAPVTGVLLLLCALFLAWLAVQHPTAPALPPSPPSAPVPV